MVSVRALSYCRRDESLSRWQFRDERGCFQEAWNARTLSAAGLTKTFVQDNLVQSAHGAVRALHYQIEHAQGKWSCAA